MTDELTWLRSLEQAVQHERDEFTDPNLRAPWGRLRGMISARIIVLLEANVIKSHKTRMSASSVYDEVCTKCGATDGRNDDRLNQPCPKG